MKEAEMVAPKVAELQALATVMFNQYNNLINTIQCDNDSKYKATCLKEIERIIPLLHNSVDQAVVEISEKITKFKTLN